MNIVQLMNEDYLQIGTKAETKEEILREIAKLAKKSPILNDISEERIFELLSERESISSTGFENGLAIPHCKIEGLSDFILGMIVVPEGIDFEAYDNNNSEILFFIIAPEGERNRHIRILSTISRLFSAKAYKKELLGQKSTSSLYESLMRCLPDEVPSGEQENSSLFTIMLRKHENLNDILQSLSTLTENVTVIEGRGAGSYLHRLPLFSSFWNSEEQESCYVITGTVNKKLANELIRNIDSISGGLDTNPGTHVVIQDVLVSAGTLN
jgi:mannitol/fructose-specific phosphotransferase system IIA component (Ntr-type)